MWWNYFSHSQTSSMWLLIPKGLICVSKRGPGILLWLLFSTSSIASKRAYWHWGITAIVPKSVVRPWRVIWIKKLIIWKPQAKAIYQQWHRVIFYAYGTYLGHLQKAWCGYNTAHITKFYEFEKSWWRHQMETFSALLTLCAGNSPVSCEFPSQRSVTRSLDVSLICAWINAWVNNREAGDLRLHRGHYDVIVM